MSNDPQPQQTDYSVMVLLIIIALVFFNGGIGGGGEKSPTKTIPTVASVFVLYDSDPAATKDLDTSHKGQADVITSIADDSAKVAVTKGAKGVWLTYGTKEPAPVAEKAGPWAAEAYTVATAAVNAGGKLPWIVASTPAGKGYSGVVPDTGNDLAAAQAATKKILDPLLK